MRQVPIIVVRVARPIQQGVDLDQQPVHAVPDRRRDVPERVLRAQDLAVGVVRVGGAMAQRVDLG